MSLDIKALFAIYSLGGVVCASFINGELWTMLDDDDAVRLFAAPWSGDEQERA